MTFWFLLLWAVFNADPRVADFDPWSPLFVAFLFVLALDLIGASS